MPHRAPSVLYLASDIAPLTGDGDGAQVARALCSALSERGARVTVAAPRAGDRDPEALGLARRLAPVRVSMDTGAAWVTLYEGTLPNGGVDVCLVDAGGDCPAETATAATARAALQRAHAAAAWPEIVHVTDLTWAAAALAKDGGAGRGPAPAAVLTVLDPDGERLERIDFSAIDAVSVPSSSFLAAVEAGGASGARVVAHGIDEARWAPARDPHIPAQFSADDPTGKSNCKLELQRELGLPPRPREPLIAIAGPFDTDVLTEATAAALTACGAQLAFVADPERDTAAIALLRGLVTRCPTRVAVREIPSADGYERMLHRLVAGADFVLLPRRPRHAGPSELGFVHYGAVPIAPAGGGAADRLVEFDLRTATGSAFLFAEGSDRGLINSVRRAVAAYRDRRAFASLVERLLCADLSWKTAAWRTIELYRAAAKARRAAAQGA